MKKVIITVSSVTYAIKGRKLLSKQNIDSRIVKIDASQSNNGCTHGIEFNSSLLLEAVRILRENGIAYSLYGE
ncbi:MAG: DUF3343 domain-containing protein [Clostridia bacterium]|nr:DUF3343 domain-containing protein [Clostridia bacterium]